MNALHLSTCCCMRADCQDENCPGRAFALQMHTADGGHDYRGGIAFPIERAPAEPRAPLPPDPVRIAVIAASLLALACAVAIALGAPLSILPF